MKGPSGRGERSPRERPSLDYSGFFDCPNRTTPWKGNACPAASILEAEMEPRMDLVPPNAARLLFRSDFHEMHLVEFTLALSESHESLATGHQALAVAETANP